MKRFLMAATAATILSSPALAGTVHTYKKDLTRPGQAEAALVIDDGDLDPSTPVYTGWMYVGSVDDLTLRVDLTHAAATRVDVSCKTSNLRSGANGTGSDVPDWVFAGAGAYDGSPLVLRWAVSGDSVWTATVKDIPEHYVNCGITGVAATTDTIDVKAYGVTP